MPFLLSLLTVVATPLCSAASVVVSLSALLGLRKPVRRCLPVACLLDAPGRPRGELFSQGRGGSGLREEGQGVAQKDLEVPSWSRSGFRVVALGVPCGVACAGSHRSEADTRAAVSRRGSPVVRQHWLPDLKARTGTPSMAWWAGSRDRRGRFRIHVLRLVRRPEDRQSEKLEKTQWDLCGNQQGSHHRERARQKVVRAHATVAGPRRKL